MQSIKTFLRSKIPVIYTRNANEQSILLDNISSSTSTKVNYFTNKEPELSYESQNVNSFENPMQIDSINQEITLQREYSTNDLYEVNDKTVVNRINEWQAGWNVTNAIQVKNNLNQVKN